MKYEDRGTDGSFDNDFTIVDIATVWAKIEPSTLQTDHQEKLRSNKIYAESTHKITIRYRANMATDMRVLYGHRTFEVLGFYEFQGERDFLNLFVKEVRK